MAKLTKTKTEDIFALNAKSETTLKEYIHVYKNNIVCKTDSRGFAQPNNANRLKIVVDATEGFIPLWKKNVTLYWRFSPTFNSKFKDPARVKDEIRNLFGEAVLGWQDACPVKFKENNDVWDFEFKMYPDDCDASGCTLARAFFPDSGRHDIALYPKLFKLTRKEQIETMQHELGHVFGLRHFFANVEETQWKSEIFGKHSPFSIMNYGSKSVLTKNDINDLRTLYIKVWSGQLKKINGTRIVTVKPFHTMK
jgi:hypothetical protein